VPQDVGTLDFVLQTGGSIAGRVEHADTGEAAANVDVMLWAADLVTDRTYAKTDALGRFSMAQVRPGEHQLGIRDDTLVLTHEALKVAVTRDKKAPEAVLKVAEGGVVTGMVRDASTGTGIAGATLNAYPEQGGTGAESRTNIKSGAEGLFRVAGLGLGRYRLRCSSVKGYKPPGWQEHPLVSASPGQVLSDVSIDLLPTPAVSGRVEDAQGSAVAGAQVEARSGNGQQQSTAATGSDGGFRLYGFMPGTDVVLAARKNHVTSTPTDSLPVGEGGLTDVVLVLDQAMDASIEGDVVDKNGHPLESFYVMALAEDQRVFRPPNVSTDEAGRFRFFHLAAGTYRMQVRAPKSYSYSPGGQEQVVLQAGEKRTGVRLVYDQNPAMNITGRVTDGKGKPVEGANVQASGPGYSYSRTEQDGTYVLTGLTEGMYFVNVYHASYTQQRRETVPAGSQGVDFTLEGTGTIEGYVVDAATNRPVTRFRIGCSQGDSPGLRMQNLAQVNDEQGHFVLPNVAVGENTVSVQAGGYAPAMALVPNVVAGRTVSNVRIALEGGGRVEGIVIDREGAAISGAKIFVGRIPDQWQRTQLPAAATTGGDGSFTVDTLATDDNQISAFHPSYAPASVPVATRPNETAYVEIVLGGGGAIEGIVLLDGEAASGIYVSARKAEILGRGDSSQGNTDATGSYRLRSLSDGEFLVQAYWYNPSDRDRSRALERPAVVEAGQVTVVDFEFTAATSVVVGQITVDGQPEPGAHVTARIQCADGEERASTPADGQGMFRLDPVPAGYVYLTVNASGRQKIVEFELAAGQTVRQDVAFGGAAIVFGTVTGLLPGAENGVAFISGRANIPAHPTALDVLQLQRLVVNSPPIEPNGTYRAENVDPGVYTIVAYSVPQNLADLRFSYSVLELAEGQETALDFVLH